MIPSNPPLHAGAKIIDGRAHAARLRAGYRKQVAALRLDGLAPALAVVLVGDDPASAVYVRNKILACEEVGISSTVINQPYSIHPSQMWELIDCLNVDPAIHGILIQLPLPPQISLNEVLNRIAPDKDVDGFHLYNMGGLVAGSTVFSPCTPFGVRQLLEAEGIPIAGQNVVVVGASNIVGKPTALMLMQQDATVCICHAKTRDLAQFTILADILVVAAGRPGLISGPMVRRGAVVIDVGINRLPDGRIVGDVDFESVRQRASFITPVPGGVGPMTVTMLLHNTILAATRSLSGSTLGHIG